MFMPPGDKRKVSNRDSESIITAYKREFTFYFLVRAALFGDCIFWLQLDTKEMGNLVHQAHDCSLS